MSDQIFLFRKIFNSRHFGFAILDFSSLKILIEYSNSATKKFMGITMFFFLIFKSLLSILEKGFKKKFQKNTVFNLSLIKQ